MNKTRWRSLLKTMEIDDSVGTLSAVLPEALDAYETKLGVKLPQSYRSFCEVFGAGDIDENFRIAVPGYKGREAYYCMQKLNKYARNRGQDSSAADPLQYDRGVFFCFDILRSFHFFDPQDVTDTKKHEYGIYAVHTDWSVIRLADTFWDYINDICLGGGRRKLMKGRSPRLRFKPVSD